MTDYRFEIVKRAKGRFSWVFAEGDGGRRRVLARADRDYRNKKRAKEAIETVRRRASGADVVSPVRSPNDTDLPATSFEFAEDVLPLPVVSGQRRRAEAKRKRTRSKPPTAQQDQSSSSTDDAMLARGAARVIAADLDAPDTSETNSPRATAAPVRRRPAKKSAPTPPTPATRTR